MPNKANCNLPLNVYLQGLNCDIYGDACAKQTQFPPFQEGPSRGWKIDSAYPSGIVVKLATGQRPADEQVIEDRDEAQNEAIYERAVVKRGGADFVFWGSRTSPSPSASVDLAHLRPVGGRVGVHPATHPLSPRPRESFLPRCR